MISMGHCMQAMAEPTQSRSSVRSLACRCLRLHILQWNYITH
uniref:Uncharacterized protein n=1 Tax=Anguilla anguilla TaxID=7936 RepID=A0A0E9UQ61_ANGAN